MHTMGIRTMNIHVPNPIICRREYQFYYVTGTKKRGISIPYRLKPDEAKVSIKKRLSGRFKTTLKRMKFTPINRRQVKISN